MSDLIKINKKCRPSLGDCGVKPLSGVMHRYLLFAYLMWPLTIAFGQITTNIHFVAAVATCFIVLGFVFYNLLVAMVQMSHEEKTRLRTSRWIFYVSLTLLFMKMAWVLTF